MANFIELDIKPVKISSTEFRKDYINIDLVVRIGDGDSFNDRYKGTLFMANGGHYYTKLDKHQLRKKFIDFLNP